MGLWYHAPARSHRSMTTPQMTCRLPPGLFCLRSRGMPRKIEAAFALQIMQRYGHGPKSHHSALMSVRWVSYAKAGLSLRTKLNVMVSLIFIGLIRAKVMQPNTRQ